MDALECLKGRRSIRKYTSQEVTDDVIRDIVGVAAYAPSWKNTQITRYIAVKDPAVKSAIADNAVPEHNKGIIDSAPVLVVVTGRQKRSGYERDGSFTTKKEDRWQNFDVGVAAQTFCLAAYEKGLGTVMMGIFDEDKVKEYVTVPDDQDVEVLIALGYPDQSPDAPKRKTVDDLLTIV